MPDASLTVQQNEAFSLAPKNLEQAIQYARLLADSAVVPQAFQKKPADVLIAVQLGMELGFSPVQALQSIAVINGRPTLWGDGVLALVRASGKLEQIDETDDGHTAKCTVKRRGEPPLTRTFSIDDAKVAGLASKPGPWQQYPGRMRQMRARSWAIRDGFADVLKGVSVREEVDDYNVVGTTQEGNQLMRRPRRIDEPSVADTKPIDAQIEDLLKPEAPKGNGNGHKAAPTGTTAAPSTAGLEKVGVIKAEDGQTKAGAPMLSFTVARHGGSTLSGYAFSAHVIAALKRGSAEGLAVFVKIEKTTGKDKKEYDNITEAVVEEPGSDPEPA